MQVCDTVLIFGASYVITVKMIIGYISISSSPAVLSIPVCVRPPDETLIFVDTFFVCCEDGRDFAPAHFQAWSTLPV